MYNEKEEMERTKGRNECSERQRAFLANQYSFLHSMHANDKLHINMEENNKENGGSVNAHHSYTRLITNGVPIQTVR